MQETRHRVWSAEGAPALSSMVRRRLRRYTPLLFVERGRRADGGTAPGSTGQRSDGPRGLLANRLGSRGRGSGRTPPEGIYVEKVIYARRRHRDHRGVPLRGGPVMTRRGVRAKVICGDVINGK